MYTASQTQAANLADGADAAKWNRSVCSRVASKVRAAKTVMVTSGSRACAQRPLRRDSTTSISPAAYPPPRKVPVMDGWIVQANNVAV